MSIDVIVVGAGVLGLAVAAELNRRGRQAAVLAPDELSASALAAGMLAPAFECVLDAEAAPHAGLLRRARDLWPDFAETIGVQIIRDGAEWRGPDPHAMGRRLVEAGFEALETADGVMTPDDWRLNPAQALTALGRTSARTVGRLVALDGDEGGFVLTTDTGQTLSARQVVLASGWRPLECGIRLPPIRPIKGQALRLSGASPERVLRGKGVYVVPATGGAVIGATMGEGRSDTAADVEITAELMQRALEIWPEMGEASDVQAFVGVRGASPDGLPVAGRIAPGLAVALGPRRNGWLLAPMVAAVVTDALDGEVDPGPFDPGRFA